MTTGTSTRAIALPVLLVGVVLAGMLMGAIYQVLVANQRISTAQSGQLIAQQALSAGIDLLAQELRGVSAVGGDLTITGDQMVAFRAPRAFGLTCEVLSEQPLTLRVAQEATAFEKGNHVYVFVDGDPQIGEDDSWHAFEILTAVDGLTCGEDGVEAQELRLSSPDPHAARGKVRQGAPVRSWQDVLYTVGQVRGEPYLIREAEGQRAPLGGPLQTENGFEIRFMDGAGELTSATREVTTVRITLRTRGEGNGLSGSVGDSLATSVFLRN